MLRLAILCLAILSIRPVTLAEGPWVTVGVPGNPPDVTGLGAVAYEFQIMKYEVTVREYTEFLNCVAAGSDPHRLWVPAMGEHVITDLGQGGIRQDVPQCIVREGEPGAWEYRAIDERQNCPVFFVTFTSAQRYANWIHNHKQGETETGAYDLRRVTGSGRMEDARVWIPNEDEWYKAAYFQPQELGGPPENYWRFPMSTMEQPINADAGSELPNAACFSKGFSGMVAVGSFPNAQSPWGALDMGGNVWEWTDTRIFETKRVLRGGSAPHNWEKLLSTVRSNASPDRWYPDTGFRLARRIEN